MIKKHSFNVEEEYDFLTERLSSIFMPSEKIKGLQMAKYLKTSILYCPDEAIYTKEELEEKYRQAQKILELLKKEIGERQKDENRIQWKSI